MQVSNPEEFVLKLSKVEQILIRLTLYNLSQSQRGAEVLNKPEKYISISYRYNEFLTFSGTLEPAFQLIVVCLGWAL